MNRLMNIQEPTKPTSELLENDKVVVVELCKVCGTMKHCCEDYAKELREKIEKEINTWEEPEWQYERHEKLVSFTTNLCRKILDLLK
jgi:hypothetical protein